MPTFRAYLHITNVEVMFKYIYVFKILRQSIVEQSDVEITTLMEVKTQEQVLRLFFNMCNHYFYSKK